MAAKNDMRKEALLQVRVQYGEITPENVVKAAEPVDSPLHDWFEWDDKAAAHQYRLEQARQLIRIVKVTRLDENDQPVKVRAFHSLQGKDKNYAYQPLDEIVLDPAQVAVLKMQAEREWKTLLKKYEHLSWFIEMVQRDLDAAQAAV